MRYKVVLFCCLIFSLVSCEPSVKQVISGYFNVDIRGIDYTVITHESQWIAFNGNGHRYIVLSLRMASKKSIEELKTQMINCNAKHLPISEEGLLHYSEIKQYFKDSSGLYVYKSNEHGSRDCGILLFDEAKMELIVLIDVS